MERYWPRKAPGLPPGQRLLTELPRFSDQPGRPPPAPVEPVELGITAPGWAGLTLGWDEIVALGPRTRPSDLHCVTTWTYRGLAWGGVPLVELWRRLVVPRAGAHADAPFVLVRGGDGYRAVFRSEDLFAPDVLVAWTLDGRPLEPRHGAPLRLVSPSQYGYKSVKHLTRFELHRTRPPGGLGAKEHLRARVAEEERHSRLPGRLLRVPYRLVIPFVASVGERNAEPGDYRRDPPPGSARMTSPR